jgi:PAB1-binding protein PBP1
LLEERGVDIDDSGMDEEDLYGAVVREPASNKYVAPALRKPAQQAKKEVKQSNPLNKLITSDLPKAGGSNPSPIANLPTTRRASSERNNTEEVRMAL